MKVVDCKFARAVKLQLFNGISLMVSFRVYRMCRMRESKWRCVCVCVFWSRGIFPAALTWLWQRPVPHHHNIHWLRATHAATQWGVRAASAVQTPAQEAWVSGSPGQLLCFPSNHTLLHAEQGVDRRSGCWRGKRRRNRAFDKATVKRVDDLWLKLSKKLLMCRPGICGPGATTRIVFKEANLPFEPPDP